MEIYVVVYDGVVSKECYSTLEQAQEFIETRSWKPIKITNLKYIDEDNKIYLIQVLKLK